MAAQRASESPTERPWAPGARAMLAYTVLMLAFLTLPAQLNFLWSRNRMEAGMPVVPFVGMAVALVFGIAAHHSYGKARLALGADPSLRGGWLVRNLWWVTAGILVLPGVITVAMFLLFFGAGALP